MTTCHTLAAPNSVGDKLSEAMRSLERLMDAYPPELRARQFVKHEKREGYVYVEIKTTFKVPVTQDL